MKFKAQCDIVVNAKNVTKNKKWRHVVDIEAPSMPNALVILAIELKKYQLPEDCKVTIETVEAK